MIISLLVRLSSRGRAS